jgi:hypothetical protein
MAGSVHRVGKARQAGVFSVAHDQECTDIHFKIKPQFAAAAASQAAATAREATTQKVHPLLERHGETAADQLVELTV